jgi:hypothetical protein
MGTSLTPPRILVSLTTISRRISKLDQVLATICNQSKPADEIHLFLSREPYLNDEGVDFIPEQLASLIDDQEIHVKYVPNTGPYRKLVPMLEQFWGDNVIIVTIDDDTLYPPDFLERLLDAFERHHCIVAFSGRRMLVDQDTGPAPYEEWPRIEPPENTNLLNFPIGKDGILYCPAFFTRQVFDPIATTLSPNNDDIWFRCNSWLKNVPVCILGNGRNLFPVIRGHRRHGLWKTNRIHNDNQLQAVASYLNLKWSWNSSPEFQPHVISPQKTISGPLT